MNEEELKEKARSNRKLLKDDPREYVRRLRENAYKLTGQLRYQLLDEADKIARENGFL